MATPRDAESRFRKTLKRERVDRKWSQSYLSTLLKSKGIDVPATGIAKIEAGSRAVAMLEAAAFADIFGVSLDALLGRSVAPKADEHHALRALIDAASQAAWQVTAVTNSLRDRATELSTYEPTDTATLRLTSACTQVSETLGEVATALWEALQAPEGFPAGDDVPMSAVSGRVKK